MILDHLDNYKQYVALHPMLEKAFEFLKETDLAKLPAGRNEVQGAELYAMVVKGPGKGKAGTRLETHRKYIDIQFSLAGGDLIGWKAAQFCTKSEGGYDAKKDIEKFSDPSDAWVQVPPGHFAIYFPADGHAPMAVETAVHKIVMKIAV